MMTSASACQDHLHKEYPKQFSKEQFWEQIKRTINGKAVSDTDIDLITEQIVTHLKLQPHNSLLDLGCGNGALAARFSNRVASYTGVDFSSYLLSIAREFFPVSERVSYIESDLRQTSNFAGACRRADKVLIYGCIAYLAINEVAQLLQDLKKLCPSLERVFVGNIPDEAKAEEFFAAREVTDYRLHDPSSPIGVWWQPSKFGHLAERAGFDTTLLRMPTHFYGAKYRFDALLTPRQPDRSAPSAQQA